LLALGATAFASREPRDFCGEHTRDNRLRHVAVSVCEEIAQTFVRVRTWSERGRRYAAATVRIERLDLAYE